MLTLLFTLLTAAGVRAQNPPVSINAKAITINELFTRIEKQGVYTFAYNNADIDLKRVVTVHAKERPIESIVRECLPEVNVQVSNNKVILTARRSDQSSMPMHKLTGTVTDENGAPINLIADGTYDRGKTTPLGRQGINGWIWGLITLDSMRYAVPDGAYNTRDDIIVEIISKQLSDGGFALSSDDADPDITAMAITALAPYYNSEKIYSYHRKALSADESKTVHEVVDEAVLCLSRLQLDTGDYKSWGTQNVESTDWVAVALCSLNIDPLSDSRFIKNGNTLFDGIMRYRMTDGGFVHSFTYDPDNPTSLPDKSNTMASEQTLYTMASLWRTKKRYENSFRFQKRAELRA